MGNVSGRKEEIRKEREEYMECAHGGAQVSYRAPLDSMVHSPPQSPPRVYPNPQRPFGMMQIQNNLELHSRQIINNQLGIPTMITWCYSGKQVAVQGSWDGWKTREYLQKKGKDFAITKLLEPGIYHYRFIVDGQWQNSRDSPLERDDMGNIFNVLDVKHYVPPMANNMSEFEYPSSPVTSYSNSPFTIQDYNKKLPELPPILQQSLLDQPSSSEGSFENPLPSVLNHLYIHKGRNNRSLAALSSTQRFRSKHVSLVLYKPVKKERK